VANNKKQPYWVRVKDPYKCPICDSNMSFCEMGDFCQNCSYAYGVAKLTQKEANKHKDIIINI